jgi:4-aminobutyrate--pyruvate transaminase
MMKATLAPNSAAARDVAYQFHPNTNARRHETVGPLIIERGEGIYVYDDAGNKYIETLAGLWCVAVGFGEQRLVEASSTQMKKLSYYHTFTHKAHVPSIDLAERLAKMSIIPSAKVMFTNSGSEANDTVVKLVWYYNNARGRPEKKKIISRFKAYHGVTVASGSLTGIPLNHRDFDLPIANILHTTCPHHYRFSQEGESEIAFADRLAADLEALILREGPETVAAFIGEPVMGAGGVIVPPETYWAKIQEVCRKYDILVIADEVITGFGRTGQMFGSQTYGIQPDIMVLSKQLTSAYLPLSAIIISDELYQHIADNSARIGSFVHGITGGGHPVAAAVALENLDIIEERDLVGHTAELAPVLQGGLRKFADHPLVGEVRGVGLIAGVEMVADKATKAGFDAPGKVGAMLTERCQDNGLILRCLGDTAAFCPPLVIQRGQIEDMLGRFGKALDETHAAIKAH